jgi:hypothetical protein
MMENPSIKDLRWYLAVVGVASWFGIFGAEPSNTPLWYFFLTFLIHAATIVVLLVVCMSPHTKKAQTEELDLPTQ